MLFGSLVQSREPSHREPAVGDPTVDIFVYDREGALLAASTGAVPRSRFRGAEPESAELRYLEEGSLEEGFLEEGFDTAVRLRLPLHTSPDRAPATLVLVQPLAAMRADLAATRRRVVCRPRRSSSSSSWSRSRCRGCG